MRTMSPDIHVCLDFERLVSWEIPQEGHSPGMGAGDERVEALRYQGDRGMGIGVQVRKDVRQKLYTSPELDSLRSSCQR